MESRYSRRTVLKGWAGLAILGSGVLAACAPQAPAAPPAPAAAAKPTEAPKPASAAPAAAASPAAAAPAAASPAAAAPAQAAPAAAAAKPAAGGTPRQGGTLAAAMDSDPVGIDPHKNAQFASLAAWEHTYQSLVTYDENLKILPALATSWETPDPLTYIFKLRQGVKFHDGSDFEADDVAFWHQRITDAEVAAPYKSWFDPVTKVTAVDKSTVKFELQTPYSPLLANLASLRGSAIVPRKWATDTKDLNKTAVGTGPFQMKEYLNQSHYIWERNKNYYEQGMPYIDRVENKLVLEEPSRVAALQSGQVGYATVTGESSVGLKSKPELNVQISQKALYYHLQMNISKKPFDDTKVRQAVMLAVNQKEIIEKVMGGYADLTGPVPTGHTDWWIPIEKLPYKVDVAKAKQLLAEAGYPNGLKVTYKAVGTSAIEVPVGVVLQSQLKQVGIDMEIIQVDQTTWVKETQPPVSNYEMRLNGNTFYPDADGYMYNHYYSKSTFNQVRVSDAKLDELVTKARSLLDHEQRRQVYYEVQDLILSQAYVVPLFNGKNIEILSSKLKGYTQSYTGRRLFLKQSWLDS